MSGGPIVPAGDMTGGEPSRGDGVRKMLIVISNAGGVGKTHSVEVLATLARYGNEAVQVVDWDAGNRGYRNRNGARSTELLPWEVDEAFDANEWFSRTCAGISTVIFDLGANFMSAGIAAGTLARIVDVATTAGFAVTFMPVEAPDKPGARGLAERIYERFSAAFDVIVIRNDNRGSKAFAEPIRVMDPPTLTMEYLSAGYESARTRTERPLHEVLEHPETGFTMASAVMAGRLLRIAKQPIVEKLFGTAMRGRLEALSAGHPNALTFVVATPDDAKDAKLRANAAVAQAHSAMLKADVTDPDACMEVVKANQAARRAYLRG